MECGGCGKRLPLPRDSPRKRRPDDGPKVAARESRAGGAAASESADRDDRLGRLSTSTSQEDDPDSHLAQKRGPGYATASMVLGILSIIIGSPATLFCCGFVQTILSVVGLILGYIGLRSDARPTAIAGMVMNVLCAIFSVVYMSFIGVWLSTGPFKAAPPPPPATAAAPTWQPNTPPSVPVKGRK